MWAHPALEGDRPRPPLPLRYQFDGGQVFGDYGHILPVELLTVEVGIAYADARLPGRLQSSLGNRIRLWNLDGFGADFERLAGDSTATRVTKTFEAGQRIQLAGEAVLRTVEMAVETPQGWQLFVDDGSGAYRKILLTPALAEQVTVVAEDGAAEPTVVLAGLWAEWMRAATLESKATTLATTPLRPYAHQTNAVYGSMLPQPRLRFLLADEPGTGKTIMAGMYLREMQRLGFVRKALVICPAHLVEKWRAFTAS